MNWIEIAAIKSFTDERFCKRSASTDGRLCKKSASCVQYITEWKKENELYVFLHSHTKTNPLKRFAFVKRTGQ